VEGAENIARAVDEVEMWGGHDGDLATPPLKSSHSGESRKPSKVTLNAAIAARAESPAFPSGCTWSRGELNLPKAAAEGRDGGLDMTGFFTACSAGVLPGIVFRSLSFASSRVAATG
jgi:hypothetical protein